MNIEKLNAEEVEQDRQGRVQELSAELGADWLDEYRAGSIGCHELLDRSAMVADMLEEYVLAHPACVARPDWYLLVDRAVSALRELYQQVGAEHLTVEESDRALPKGEGG